MPRYIDEKDVYKLVEPTGIARVHCSQIDELPRADVAPKSEVAREFFEEIERVLPANMSGEFRGDSIEWFDYFDLHLAEDIAELKKKYIGEQNNGR